MKSVTRTRENRRGSIGWQTAASKAIVRWPLFVLCRCHALQFANLPALCSTATTFNRLESPEVLAPASAELPISFLRQTCPSGGVRSAVTNGKRPSGCVRVSRFP
jgi:hypothetical protein